MPVSIIDVAKHAGVSKSTVSLVIHNSDLVKPATKAKVLASIKALNYVPNLNARSLTTQKTNILGIIVIVEDEPLDNYEYDYETGLFSRDISKGIPDGLRGTDYGVLTERFQVGGKQPLPELILQNRVDGIFIIGGLFDNAFVDKILKRSVPSVLIGRHHHQLDSITANVKKGAYIATQHLFQTGHRRICYINCPRIFISAEDRFEGFREAAQDQGMTIPADMLRYSPMNTGRGGYLAMKEVWESGLRPDAIAAANEPIALGIMRYLYEQKVRVPDDISLIGYEDSIIGGYSAPPLTTINISKEYMGERAAKLLLNRMDHPDAPVENIIIEPKLIVRQTVANR